MLPLSFYDFDGYANEQHSNSDTLDTYFMAQ